MPGLPSPLPSGDKKRFRWPAAAVDHSMWRFRENFPLTADARSVTLGEGGTPLIPSRLKRDVELIWKDETRNPTGSHKDRALSLAVTHAVSIGARAVAVVSAGSTGIAGAAYAARAGLPSITLMGRGVPHQRIYPVFALGSRLIQFDCGIDDLIAALQRLNGRNGLYVASTTRASNPIQAEAARTIAYEIVEDLGRAPDWILVPTGGGGTLAAIGRGLLDLRDAGIVAKLPRLAAIVPEGYDALRVALERGVGTAEAFAALAFNDDRATVLTKLAHAHPPDGLDALEILRQFEGVVIPIADDAAIDAVARIGSVDGLYLEPSSAVVIPAVERLRSVGALKPRQIVVALACGSAFRETFLLQERRPPTLNVGRLEDLPTLLDP